MVREMLTTQTTLSAWKERRAINEHESDVPDRMIESMRQSLRVEGYHISHVAAREAALQALAAYPSAATQEAVP